MPRPGPRTTNKYSDRFKATAVRPSELPGVAVQDVAESLYTHPFMLSRWRKQMREGQIASKGMQVDLGHSKRTHESGGFGIRVSA